MLSKHLEMSPSIIQEDAWNFWLMYFNAVWQLLCGLNPWLVSLNRGSKMASRISLIPSCTSLSLGDAIVMGLVPPDAFDICILLPALN